MSDLPAPRLFTIEEANALLPRLREILATLREAKAAAMRAQEELAGRTAGPRGNGHVAPGGATQRLNAEMEDAQHRLVAAVQEIADLGCELKDPERGMVDFRTRREGRVVYLCWLMHEPEVMFWHELEGGYAGRQPL